MKATCPCCAHVFDTAKVNKVKNRVGSTPDPNRLGWHLWPEVLCADGKMRQFGATSPTPKNYKAPKHVKPYGVYDWFPAYLHGIATAKEIEERINAPYPEWQGEEVLSYEEHKKRVAVHNNEVFHAAQQLVEHVRNVFKCA